MEKVNGSLTALTQLEIDIKLAHIELVPIREGDLILPEHIRTALHNARFVKKVDYPLLAYGLFCLDEDSQPFCFDSKIRKRVLDRVSKTEAKNNSQIGRALVRGYFETLVNSSDLVWTKEFSQEIKSIVLLHSDNQFFSEIVDKTPDQLAEYYDSKGFDDLIRMLGGGCLNETSDYCMSLWRATIPKFIGQMHVNTFRLNLDVVCSQVVDFIFFKDTARLREIAGSLTILKEFIKLINSPFRGHLTLAQKGMLLDLAGWLYKDNLRLKDFDLHNVQEEVREVALR